MLCFLRNRSSTLNYAGLIEALGSGRAGNWKSHCEVVIGANVGGDRTMYLVGGNVANAVVMRKLMLDRTGLLELPKANNMEATASITEQGCSPGHEEECNLNRQDWAALLKLTAIAPIPAPIPQQAPIARPAAPLPSTPDVPTPPTR
ncbi:hypothetical protein D3C81_1497290 [compost metagenome]